MANLDQLGLPNGSTYNFKDNTQERSDHRHYESDLIPLVHKTYASTSYYSTNSSWDNSTWYFMSVKPDSWYTPWKVRFKIRSFCPAYTNVDSITWATVCGRADSVIYANWNERYDPAHYYTTYYVLKKAGFDAGYGHAIGISILYGTGYTTAAYYRTFEVDYFECENCTVTILDTPVKWASWPGTGTTNYNGLNSMNAVDRGLQESGDADTIDSRMSYFCGRTGSKGIWAGSLFMEDSSNTYQNICTATDGTATNSNRTTGTKIANTTGFKPCTKVYYSIGNYNPNSDINGWGAVYSECGLFDARYAFNVTLTANSLTPYKPIYLVGTINSSDGLFYLDSTWWTQTPTTTGKVYVLVGSCYDSTTSNCRINLYEHNTWYKYDGSKLIMISNGATQLVSSSIETTDKTPYLLRPSFADGNEYDKLVGGTVAFNQNVPISASSITTTINDVTLTDNRDGTYTLSGTASGDCIFSIVSQKTWQAHKFVLLGGAVNGSTTKYSLAMRGAGGDVFDFGGGAIWNANGNTWKGVVIYVKNGQNADGLTFKPQLIDLTQMLGATIADYIYSLEQGTAGAGVAWFKRLFNKPYYAYNAGELMSVKTSAHKLVGFNALNYSFIIGKRWSGAGDIENGSNQNACITSLIKCLPNTTYCFYMSNYSKATYVYFSEFDANENHIYKSSSNTINSSTHLATYTTGANTYFIGISLYSNADFTAGELEDINFNISWDGERDGEYEPYEANVYPLDANLELRGIPKLDANNNLYYDGDTYESTGNVSRNKYVTRITGNETSFQKANDTEHCFQVTNNEYPPEFRPIGNVWRYETTYTYGTKSIANTDFDIVEGIYTRTTYALILSLPSCSTIDEAKAFLASHPVFVGWDINPFTETADTFTNPQIVNDFGTEEYIDSRAVPIPVGHETVYCVYDDRAKLDSLPDFAVYNGTYAIQQTDGKMTLVDTSTISVGDAETVNGHTVAKDVPSNAVFTDTTYTLGTSGNNVTLTPSSGSAQSVTAPYATSAGSATKATQDESGNNIKATYANSFSISDHTITLKNKNGTSLGTVTVPDNNTTYTFANGTNGFTVTPSGGSAQTVTVTPSIANNITGSGTSGYLTKFNGTNTITNGPQLGSSTTTYLNNAGSWATPPDTKNTAGSTDTSSKIFLIGATSQAANPQTYSDNEVYATSGVLTTKSVQVGGGSCTLQYNSTTQSCDFIFT